MSQALLRPKTAKRATTLRRAMNGEAQEGGISHLRPSCFKIGTATKTRPGNDAISTLAKVDTIDWSWRCPVTCIAEHAHTNARC